MTEEKKAVEEVVEPTEAVKEEKSSEATTDTTETTMSDLRPGMTVRIHQTIKELNMKGEEKKRIQYFEGMVIAKKHGSEAGGTVTVRKVSNGVAVEKIFPLNLPTIEKVEIKKIARVRRAKLFFLADGYKKKLKERTISSK